MALPESLIRLWMVAEARGLRAHPMPPHLANINRPSTRLTNIAFESSRFRKLHVEMGTVNHVTVVHSVMYPRPSYAIPIVAMDVVSLNNVPSFAIVDACPVTPDLTLPDQYDDLVHGLQTTYHMTPTPRSQFPEWGKKIFSDRCVMLRGPHLADGGLANFQEYALSLAATHLAWAALQSRVPDDDEIETIKAAHTRFSTQQRRNAQTRGALALALGPAMADEYMHCIMFD